MSEIIVVSPSVPVVYRVNLYSEEAFLSLHFSSLFLAIRGPLQLTLRALEGALAVAHFLIY